MTQAWCEAVVKATHEVGSFILNERRNFISSDVEYKGKNDLVSYVDRTAESILVERLSLIVPEAGFLTEEKTIDPIEKEFQWIIDPLDGTTNFIHGIPCFCISIALHHFGQPVIGVVHELNQDECFYAWKDGGAYMNGQTIRTSATADFQQTLIATGFPYHNYSKMKKYMSVFDFCMRNTRGLRRLGSAAADLAYVAAGRFDAFYEYGLNQRVQTKSNKPQK